MVGWLEFRYRWQLLLAFGDRELVGRNTADFFSIFSGTTDKEGMVRERGRRKCGKYRVCQIRLERERKK